MSSDYADLVAVDIVEKLEAELDKSVYEFTLYEYIDPDALDQLVRSSSRDSELSISFRIEGHLVTVQDGDVEVGPV